MLGPRETIRLPFLKSPALLPWPVAQAVQFRRVFYVIPQTCILMTRRSDQAGKSEASMKEKRPGNARNLLRVFILAVHAALWMCGSGSLDVAVYGKLLFTDSRQNSDGVIPFNAVRAADGNAGSGFHVLVFVGNLTGCCICEARTPFTAIIISFQRGDYPPSFKRS